MPIETQNAVIWALQEEGITKETYHQLVDKVREYFNINSIVYDSFCYVDLIPYLTLSE